MREVDVTQPEAALARGVTVLDVREPMEYAQAHVPGAVPIPMGQLSARTGELDKGSTVLVICATGNRSSAMTDLLTAAGFDAYNVAGARQLGLDPGRERAETDDHQQPHDGCEPGVPGDGDAEPTRGPGR